MVGRTAALIDGDVDGHENRTPEIPYNTGMNTEKDETTPVENGETPLESTAKPTVSLSPELLAAGRADKAAWKSGKGTGRWATIGCGLGIVVLIAALFTGSTLMRKTVWAGFAGASQRVMAYLAGDVQPQERMRLKRNLDAFAAHLKNQDDPFPVMGEFQRLTREALEDQSVDRAEVDELNLFLEAQLAGSALAVPYSMPSVGGSNG